MQLLRPVTCQDFENCINITVYIFHWNSISLMGKIQLREEQNHKIGNIFCFVNFMTTVYGKKMAEHNDPHSFCICTFFFQGQMERI